MKFLVAILKGKQISYYWWLFCVWAFYKRLKKTLISTQTNLTGIFIQAPGTNRIKSEDFTYEPQHGKTVYLTVENL